MPHTRPPSYATVDIPHATRAFQDLQHAPPSKGAKLPTSDECLAHLKLLECFYRIREEIGSREGLFGIQDSYVPVGAQGAERDEIQAKIREKRWEIYVTKACFRFQVWWGTIERGSKMITEPEMEESSYGLVASNSRPIYFDANNLPPLDVLLVLHAFFLNPRSFLADCLRFGKMGFWAAGMPWEAISRAIDSSTYEYKPVQEAQEAFTRLTRRPWDLAAEQPTMGLKCGRCATAVVTPLTTTNTIASWSTEQPGESGRGYADKGFEIECRCGQKLSHEYQRLQKFKNEMRSLFKERVPMPGTLLMISGMTDVASKATAGRGAWPMTFPNRMIQAGLGKPLARLCSKEDARVKDILDEITRALDDEALVTRAMGSKTHKPSQPERIAIRRMLSSYWDNSSRFNLDLIGAVIRQTTFTTKMHNLGWVRSPFPNPLVAHFLTRYRNYFTLLEHFPKRNVVPCLDIDLIWHTHQTLPSSYYAYSVERTGTFVDHDDKIGSTELGDSFEWTCKTYQHLFSQPYAECHCWYCAAIRESISTDTNTQPKLKSRSKLSSPFRSKFKLKPDDPKSPLPSPLSPGFPQSPLPSPSSFSPSSSSFPPTTPSVSVSDLAVQEGPHLSTHNSTPTDLSNPALYLQTMQATNRLNLHYTNACERATSEGRPLPPRYRLPPPSSRPADLSALSDPREWISPNLPDGEIHPGLYVANPLCAGAAGSCVSGGLGEGLGLGLSGKVGGGKGIADAGCGGIGGCGSGGDEGVGAGALLLLGGGGGA